MKMSNTYFKKLDDLAKWMFKSKNVRENPSTQPEQPKAKECKVGYMSFRNESGREVPIEQKGKIDFLSEKKQVKTEREQNEIFSSRDSAKYIKKTARGKDFPMEGCTICLDAPANAVLMDCGHGAICFECGIALLKTTCECHLCRRPVIQVLKIDTKFVNDDMLKVLEAADLYNVIKYTTQGDALHTANA